MKKKGGYHDLFFAGFMDENRRDIKKSWEKMILFRGIEGKYREEITKPLHCFNEGLSWLIFNHKFTIHESG